MKEFTYTVKDATGIHARPAGLITKRATEFKCNVSITTDSGSADAKRIMSVMRLGAKQGTILTVRCEGVDEDTAAREMQKFLEANI